ncbi:helix-turn-helix domain-containing protein [Saccharothrix syringae]|uniref:Helix-turn-helix domain-containing protein n=1 Tax=Saccharothrix syringae TaxID=103733 RepID=A0A5Q0HAS3_SACSY|nr:helix-turn-helix domain-containing protein [Saccharothrix syringae]QFZ23346.1 helix-turn-helix domain-containing protein [Saccharothrix syringae]
MLLGAFTRVDNADRGLAVSELSDALRAARETTGLSLTRMAQLTHYSKPYLSLIETGKRRPVPEVVTAYEQVLGVPIGSDPLRRAHEWLVSDSPTAVQRRSGRRVGDSLADALDARVVELRHLDDVVGSADLLPAVRQELAEVESLVRNGSYTEPVGRRLLTATGELAQLAGWVASDAGKYADAQRLYLGGVDAAEEAGNDSLAAQLFSSLSYQVANVADPHDALLLARTAAKGARSATPVVRALLLERVAWASAKTGDRDATLRALDAVDDTYEQRSPGIEEPEWVYWLNRAEIDVMAGRCMIELGTPDRAEPLLSAAVATYPEEHSREVALYLSWLAESYARTGELDAATATLERARRFAARMPSARTDERFKTLEGLLPL